MELRYNDPEKLFRVGVCLSDVFVNTSTIPGAGKGLFARRFFQKDELVTVSPVIFLPLDSLVDSINSSVIVNYVLVSSEEEIEIGALPLGYPGLINHASGNDSNIDYLWYDWDLDRQPQARAIINQLTLQFSCHFFPRH